MADTTAVRDPVRDHLLTPRNAVLAMIDYQPEQYAGLSSIDQQVVTLRTFDGPPSLTTAVCVLKQNIVCEQTHLGLNEDVAV
jgi:hypothetical protein